MNSREDILAEINTIKILVCKLWQESHSNISKEDWAELKDNVIKKMRKSEKVFE